MPIPPALGHSLLFLLLLNVATWVVIGSVFKLSLGKAMAIGAALTLLTLSTTPGSRSAPTSPAAPVQVPVQAPAAPAGP